MAPILGKIEKLLLSGPVVRDTLPASSYEGPAMSEDTHNEATAAVTEIWKILLNLQRPQAIGDVLASSTVLWAEALSGSDHRARAAALEAFTDAVGRELQVRAAMVAGHD
jgi:hypothetical protein